MGALFPSLLLLLKLVGTSVGEVRECGGTGSVRGHADHQKSCHFQGQIYTVSRPFHPMITNQNSDTLVTMETVHAIRRNLRASNRRKRSLKVSSPQRRCPVSQHVQLPLVASSCHDNSSLAVVQAPPTHVQPVIVAKCSQRSDRSVEPACQQIYVQALLLTSDGASVEKKLVWLESGCLPRHAILHEQQQHLDTSSGGKTAGERTEHQEVVRVAAAPRSSRASLIQTHHSDKGMALIATSGPTSTIGGESAQERTTTTIVTNSHVSSEKTNLIGSSTLTLSGDENGDASGSERDRAVEAVEESKMVDVTETTTRTASDKTMVNAAGNAVRTSAENTLEGGEGGVTLKSPIDTSSSSVKNTGENAAVRTAIITMRNTESTQEISAEHATASTMETTTDSTKKGTTENKSAVRVTVNKKIDPKSLSSNSRAALDSSTFVRNMPSNVYRFWKNLPSDKKAEILHFMDVLPARSSPAPALFTTAPPDISVPVDKEVTVIRNYAVKYMHNSVEMPAPSFDLERGSTSPSDLFSESSVFQMSTKATKTAGNDISESRGAPGTTLQIGAKLAEKNHFTDEHVLEMDRKLHAVEHRVLADSSQSTVSSIRGSNSASTSNPIRSSVNTVSEIIRSNSNVNSGPARTSETTVSPIIESSSTSSSFPTRSWYLVNTVVMDTTADTTSADISANESANTLKLNAPVTNNGREIANLKNGANQNRVSDTDEADSRSGTEKTYSIKTVLGRDLWPSSARSLRGTSHSSELMEIRRLLSAFSLGALTCMYNGTSDRSDDLASSELATTHSLITSLLSRRAETYSTHVTRMCRRDLVRTVNRLLADETRSVAVQHQRLSQELNDIYHQHEKRVHNIVSSLLTKDQLDGISGTASIGKNDARYSFKRSSDELANRQTADSSEEFPAACYCRNRMVVNSLSSCLRIQLEIATQVYVSFTVPLSGRQAAKLPSLSLPRLLGVKTRVVMRRIAGSALLNKKAIRSLDPSLSLLNEIANLMNSSNSAEMLINGTIVTGTQLNVSTDILLRLPASLTNMLKTFFQSLEGFTVVDSVSNGSEPTMFSELDDIELPPGSCPAVDDLCDLITRIWKIWRFFFNEIRPAISIQIESGSGFRLVFVDGDMVEDLVSGRLNWLSFGARRFISSLLLRLLDEEPVIRYAFEDCTNLVKYMFSLLNILTEEYVPGQSGQLSPFFFLEKLTYAIFDSIQEFLHQLKTPDTTDTTSIATSTSSIPTTSTTEQSSITDVSIENSTGSVSSTITSSSTSTLNSSGGSTTDSSVTTDSTFSSSGSTPEFTGTSFGSSTVTGSSTEESSTATSTLPGLTSEATTGVLSTTTSDSSETTAFSVYSTTLAESTDSESTATNSPSQSSTTSEVDSTSSTSFSHTNPTTQSELSTESQASSSSESSTEAISTESDPDATSVESSSTEQLSSLTPTEEISSSTSPTAPSTSGVDSMVVNLQQRAPIVLDLKDIDRILG